MQNDFVLNGRPMEVPAARDIIGEIQTLVSTCREMCTPVIYTQHILQDDFDISPLETTYIPILKSVGMRRGTNGVDIVEELTPHPGDVVVEKHRYDAFHNTRLESVLRSIRGLNAIDTVIVTGTLTEVCCESTVRSAFMRDYKVALASDATGALGPAAQDASENVISAFFGRVMTVQDVQDELHEDA